MRVAYPSICPAPAGLVNRHLSDPVMGSGSTGAISGTGGEVVVTPGGVRRLCGSVSGPAHAARRRIGTIVKATTFNEPTSLHRDSTMRSRDGSLHGAAVPVGAGSFGSTGP